MPSSAILSSNLYNPVVTGISITGSNSIYNYINLTGLGGLQVTQSGQTIAFSGGAGSSTNTGSLTGNFYPLNSNPSGYLMGNTGTILEGQLLIGSSGINGFQQGNLYGLTGIVIVSGSGNIGVGIDTNVVSTGFRVTGSNILLTANFTGIGGAQVILSGNNTVVFSGGAGNTNTIVNTYTVANTSGLHSIWVPAAAMTPSNVSAPITGTILTINSGLTYDVLDFSQTSINSAYFNLAFPLVWDKTNVIPSFYWTTTGNAGDVNWYLAGADIKDGTTLNVQYNSGVLINDTTISGNYLHQTTGANLIISGNLTDNDNCYFKVYRNSGSLTSAARLIGVNLQYYETGLNASPTGVTGISVTGSAALNYLINITGLGSVSTVLLSNTIRISGAGAGLNKWSGLIGNGILTGIHVNHNLGTSAITYSICETGLSGNYDYIQTTAFQTGINVLSFAFASGFAPFTNQYLVTVIA